MTEMRSRFMTYKTETTQFPATWWYSVGTVTGLQLKSAVFKWAVNGFNNAHYFH